MRRQKNVNNSNAERSVRRISYLRATANDISLQESEKIEDNVNEQKAEKPLLSEELQMLEQLFKRLVLSSPFHSVQNIKYSSSLLFAIEMPRQKNQPITNLMES